MKLRRKKKQILWTNLQRIGMGTYMAKFMVQQKILGRLGNLVSFPGDKLQSKNVLNLIFQTV